MTQAVCESMKLLRDAATDSEERCTAILPGPQTIESKSRCAKPSRTARARAYVLFPEPELPKTRTFMRPNETKMSDGGRGRASLGVKVWKSCQKWSVRRSAVRSIAWLGLCGFIGGRGATI